MSISLLNRLIHTTLKPPKYAVTTRITLSSMAENYYAHFKNNPQNPEKSMLKPKVTAFLDAPCVTDVVKRFSSSNPKLGLRFFIWAGVQSNYRHSDYMYSMACNVLEIRRKPGLVREVVEGYRVDGCVTDVKLFKVLLKLCKAGRACEEGLWLLRKIEEFGCRPDTTMYNAVIGLFCEGGDADVDVAVGLMGELEGKGLCPDMITYMAMLNGFCGNGRLEEACLLFKEMGVKRCIANVVPYSTLLGGLCRFGDSERALGLLEEMEKEGGECAPGVITYTSVMQCLCEKGKSLDALSILDRMECYKVSPNRVTVAVLLNGLCAEGCIDKASELVGRIVAEGQVPSGECYSSFVISLLKNKKVEDGVKLFRWMLNSDLRPKGLACSMVLKTMCAKGSFLDVFYLIEDIEKKGLVVAIDSDIYSILLVGLCRGMNVDEVAKLSSLMIKKGIRVKSSSIKDIQRHLNKNTRRLKSLAQLFTMIGK